MTSFSGYYINGAVCCGARYSTRRYRSINLMSSAYWSDGYREQSLMPNDHGLRRCKCGNFFLQSELVTISEVDETDEPLAPRVPPQDLPSAIAQARTQAIELAARLDYWQYLNHPYRDLYRTHRDAEDAATQAAWEVANPDQRTAWQKLRKMDRRPRYAPAVDRSITFPVFEASPAQRENMMSLLGLIETSGDRYSFEKVELNRELGRFDESRIALNEVLEKDSPGLFMISKMLIDQHLAAPVRYSA